MNKKFNIMFNLYSCYGEFFNEIALCAMKSEQVRMKSADADEIKSVISSCEAGFHPGGISSTLGGFIPSVRTDLIEKEKTRYCVSFLFLELIPRFELGTSSLPRMCSTA